MKTMFLEKKRRRTGITLILLLFAVLLIFFSLLYVVSTVKSGSWNELVYGRTNTYRTEPQVLTRENDCVVVTSSSIASSGKLYYIRKNGLKWSIAQTIDLTKYLKSRHIPTYWEAVKLGSGDKSIQYNDDWLLINLQLFPDVHDRRNIGEPTSILIFKKTDGISEFSRR